MGESMGAVTALMSMAKVNFSELPLENRQLFCIADCPFSDWDSQMVLQGQKRFGFNPSPLLPLVKSIIRRRTGADMNESPPSRPPLPSRCRFCSFTGRPIRWCPIQ